jgi:hypothetical protein
MKGEEVRGDGLIGRARARHLLGGTRLLAGFVVILDLPLPFAQGLARLVVEDEGGIARVVGELIHRLIEIREPVLDARITLPGAHRAIERVVAGMAAERRGVGAAEAADRLIVDEHLRHRG